MHESKPLASVIIPVRNGAATLGVQLSALANQQHAPAFEVIVADNGSTDATREVAASFTGCLNLRIVDASEERGPSFARNVGAASATSSDVLFCDADDRVSRVWVGAMHRALSVRRIVTGPIIYVDAVSAEQEPALPRKMPTGPRQCLDQVSFAGSGNLAMRMDVMAEFGGFDSALRSGEDADLSIRAQVAGYALGWVSEAIVFTARRPSLTATAHQFFRYGYYDVLLYRKLRGKGLSQRTVAQFARPYAVLALTPYRLVSRRRRLSWIVNASQRAGRIVGSARFGVFCP